MDREEVRALIAAGRRAGTKRPRPQPEGDAIAENVKRTRIEDFIPDIPCWRDKYLEGNMSTFRWKPSSRGAGKAHT